MSRITTSLVYVNGLLVPYTEASYTNYECLVYLDGNSYPTNSIISIEVLGFSDEGHFKNRKTWNEEKPKVFIDAGHKETSTLIYRMS